MRLRLVLNRHPLSGVDWEQQCCKCLLELGFQEGADVRAVIHPQEVRTVLTTSRWPARPSFSRKVGS